MKNKNSTEDAKVKAYNTQEVKELLGIGTKMMNSLVDSGILRPTTIGMGFKFFGWQIEEFERNYIGYDLGTYQKCLEAKKAVEKFNSESKLHAQL